MKEYFPIEMGVKIIKTNSLPTIIRNRGELETIHMIQSDKDNAICVSPQLYNELEIRCKKKGN